MEKDMAPAVAVEEVAAPGEEGAVKKEGSVGEDEGELLVKSAPNDELNSKMSHDVVPGDIDTGESVVAVAGSVDDSMEAQVSSGAEPDTVSPSVDAEPAPSSDVADATEKVESWDLSEALAKNVQNGVDNEDLKPKISEEESPEDFDTQDGSVESVDSIEDSVERKPVSVSSDVDDKAENSEHAGGVTEVASEITGSEDVSAEIPAEGSAEEVESEALGAPVEEVHEVMEATTNAEPDEELASLKAVPSPSDDVEDKSVEVSSEDVSEVASILPSESADNKDESPEILAEEPSDNVASQALDAPVDSERLDAQVVPEVVEPTTNAEADEGSASVESVSAPADDVEDKSVEVNSGDMTGVTTALESADNEDVNPEILAEEPSDNVASQALDAPVDSEGLDAQVVPEVVEPTTNLEADEGSASVESVSTAADDVEDKAVEVNSGDVTEVTTALESADSEDVNPEILAEESSENVDSEIPDAPVDSEGLEPQAIHEVMGPTASAEADEGSTNLESDDAEDKSVEVNSEDTSETNTVLPSESADKEDVSPELPAEGSADNVGSGAFYAPIEEVHEVVEATISAEPDEESAEPESVPAPSDDIEDKSVAVDSGDVTVATTESESADNEVVSPEVPGEESADNVSSEALEPEAGHEVVESTTSAEPDEGSVVPESVCAPSDGVKDRSVDVSFEDVTERTTKPDSADNEIVNPELPAKGSADKVDAHVEKIGEVEDAATNAEPDEESASLEPVAAPSDDAQSTPEEVEPVAAPTDSAQSMPDEVEREMSVPKMEEESIMATSTPLPAEEELFDLLEDEHEQSEVSHEGSAEHGVDTITDIKENDTGEHTSEESLGGATSGDVPDNSQGLSSEEPSDFSLESQEESVSAEEGAAIVDRCLQVEEISRESAAESQRSVSTDVEVNTGDEEKIAKEGDVIKEESPDIQSVSANGDLSTEDVTHLLQTEMTDEEAAHVATRPGEDVSHLLQTEITDEEAVRVATQPVEDVSHLLQTVMTDEEVKLAADHHPDNSVAPEESVEDMTPPLESESANGESSIPHSEASGVSQANEVESLSREFNFSDFSEAPTTSEVVRESGDESHDAVTSEQVTPYLTTSLATASGEKGQSSDAAASDATPSETSSPPPAVEHEVAPKSYNLDEVATNLHDAAEKTLEDEKSSNIGNREASVAQSVAQIVLEESSKAGDSSEYISGVVQHVAQFAHDAGQSDPNILPDTVARVFDGETAGSPANGASQTKETTSLGTMVSLFIVWCVSLCASRISSKDMPAPALKLAAEEVAAVLHSNAPSQSAPPQETTSSNH